MGKRYVYKIIRDTKLWRKGQKVYEKWGTGALAVCVKGRYKGKGRWIEGWVHTPDFYKNSPIMEKSFKGKPDAILLS